MAGVRINCPNCGRVLGDTEQSIDAVCREIARVSEVQPV